MTKFIVGDRVVVSDEHDEINGLVGTYLGDIDALARVQLGNSQNVKIFEYTSLTLVALGTEHKAQLAAIEATINTPVASDFWTDFKLAIPEPQVLIFLVVAIDTDLRVTVGTRDAQPDCYLTHIGSFRPRSIRYWAEIPKLL